MKFREYTCFLVCLLFDLWPLLSSLLYSLDWARYYGHGVYSFPFVADYNRERGDSCVSFGPDHDLVRDSDPGTHG
jgi:hypothetical protein